MTWTEHRSIHYAVLGAVILLFFGSLAAAVYDHLRRTEAFEETFRNTSWVAAQAEREFLVFESTLSKFMNGVESVSHDDVVVRFEIFWSRLPIILEGSEGSRVREVPGAVENMESVLESLARIEPIVYELRRDDTAGYQAILDEHAAFRGPLHRLVQEALVYTTERDEFSRYQPVFRVSMFLVGILMTGTILVLLLLRERRRIGRLLALTSEAERRAEAARLQLSEAVEICPDGIALYDSRRRLVFANSRYREIYGLSESELPPGTRLESLLEYCFDRGDYAAPRGDRETWLERRLRQHDDPSGPVEQKLADGRWIRIHERKTRDGGVIGLRADITGMKDREETLTGVVRQNQQFAAAIAAAPIGVLIARTDDGNWPVTYVNETYGGMVGEKPDAIIGQPWLRHNREIGELVEPRYRLDRMEGDGPLLTQRRFRRFDGSDIHVEIRLSPVHDDDGNLLAVVGLYDDITERVRQHEALRDSEGRLKNLATNIPGVLYQRRYTRGEGVEYTYISEQLEALFPVDMDTVRSDPTVLAGIVHPEDRRDWQRAQKSEGAGNEPRILEHRFRARDGHTLWIRTVEQAETQSDGSLLWSGLLLNVTEQKKIESRLEHLAYHDPLTGLANRARFEDRLTQAMAFTARRDEPMAMHYIDLDNFKEVNDTLGHKAGDQLLTAVSRQLCSVVRDTDTVARMSGDEFAVIQSNLGEAGDAVTMAEKLITAVSRPVQLDGRVVSAGCSIGLVLYRGEELEPEELPMRADMALYRAKSEGKGIYRFYDTAMDTEMRNRIEASRFPSTESRSTARS